MKTIKDFFETLAIRLTLLKNDQRGQTLVEYALIIVVIALLCVAAMKTLKTEVSNTYTNAANTLKNP